MRRDKSCIPMSNSLPMGSPPQALAATAQPPPPRRWAPPWARRLHRTGARYGRGGRWLLRLAARGVAVVVHGGALGIGLAREGEGGRCRRTAKRVPRPGSSPRVCWPMGHVCCYRWKLLVWAVDLFWNESMILAHGPWIQFLILFITTNLIACPGSFRSLVLLHIYGLCSCTQDFENRKMNSLSKWEQNKPPRRRMSLLLPAGRRSATPTERKRTPLAKPPPLSSLPGGKTCRIIRRCFSQMETLLPLSSLVDHLFLCAGPFPLRSYALICPRTGGRTCWSNRPQKWRRACVLVAGQIYCRRVCLPFLPGGRASGGACRAHRAGGSLTFISASDDLVLPHVIVGFWFKWFALKKDWVICWVLTHTVGVLKFYTQ
jgi:hypothetical protein